MQKWTLKDIYVTCSQPHSDDQGPPPPQYLATNCIMPFAIRHILSSIYLPLRFYLEHFLCFSGPFPPTDYTHLMCHLLCKCFSCISLVAFVLFLHYIALLLCLLYISYFSWASVQSLSQQPLTFILSLQNTQHDTFVRVCAL